MVAQHSLKLCVRQKIPASLVYLDLDNFKFINDTFGHAEGNRVLMLFAQQMGALCRESDLFARLGGDEFVMLLTNVDKNSAEDVIARLQQSLDEYTKVSNLDYEMTFSYGIVEYSIDKHHSIDALLEHGDSLMYEYKKAQK